MNYPGYLDIHGCTEGEMRRYLTTTHPDLTGDRIHIIDNIHDSASDALDSVLYDAPDHRIVAARYAVYDLCRTEEQLAKEYDKTSDEIQLLHKVYDVQHCEDDHSIFKNALFFSRKRASEFTECRDCSTQIPNKDVISPVCPACGSHTYLLSDEQLLQQGNYLTHVRRLEQQQQIIYRDIQNVRKQNAASSTQFRWIVRFSKE